MFQSGSWISSSNCDSNLNNAKLISLAYWFSATCKTCQFCPLISAIQPLFPVTFSHPLWCHLLTIWQFPRSEVNSWICARIPFSTDSAERHSYGCVETWCLFYMIIYMPHFLSQTDVPIPLCESKSQFPWLVSENIHFAVGICGHLSILTYLFKLLNTAFIFRPYHEPLRQFTIKENLKSIQLRKVPIQQQIKFHVLDKTPKFRRLETGYIKSLSEKAGGGGLLA